MLRVPPRVVKKGPFDVWEGVLIVSEKQGLERGLGPISYLAAQKQGGMKISVGEEELPMTS